MLNNLFYKKIFKLIIPTIGISWFLGFGGRPLFFKISSRVSQFARWLIGLVDWFDIREIRKLENIKNAK